MANTKTGNIHQIDTTANDLETKGILIYYAIVTPTAGNGYVLLLDSSAGAEAIRLSGDTAQRTAIYDFSNNPISLPKGLHTTVSSAKATLVVKLVG